MSGASRSFPQSAQSGSGAILPWVTGTAYIAGQPVTNSGHTYTANDAHTAGATFAGDLASHWTLLPITAADVGAQPVDSDLTAIAALTTTSYGRAFLALADAAAGRTALGLGTASTQATGAFDASGAAAAAQAASQPLDSDLTAIAALTTTSYGRALLALADAAAGRTAFGLGTAATLASDTDGTLAANSDARAATQKAVKTYVDAHAGSPVNFPGSQLAIATELTALPTGVQTDGSTVLQHQSRTLRTLRRAGNTVSLVFENRSKALNAASTDDVTIRASVEGPGSVVQPVFFRGAREATMAPDSLLISDPVSYPHAKDDVVAVRMKITVASTKRFQYNWVTVGGGEGREESATTVTDKIDSGTITASGGEYTVSPFAVLTDFHAGDLSPVIMQGDSIGFGYTDSPYAAGAGPVYQALAHTRGFLNLAEIGEQAASYISASAHTVASRRLLTTAGRYVVNNYGTNDIQASRSLAQVKADILTIATWNYRGGQQTFQCTVIPRVDTSDSMVTLSGQSPFLSTPAKETIRVAYNNWLRDGAPIDATTKAAVAIGTSSNVLRAAVYDATGTLVTAASGTGHPITGVFEWADTVESSRDSGKWKVTGAPNPYTDDGTHPNVAGNLLIAPSVPISVFA